VKMPRLSIAALMLMLVIIAVGLAALSRPTQLAAAFLFSTSLLVLTVAIVGALHGRGATRAFWSGFAIGGWMYLSLQYGPFCETQIGPYTFPTTVLDVLYEAMNPRPSPPRPVATIPVTATNTGMAMMMLSMAGAGPPSSPSLSAWEAWTELDHGRVWGGTRASSSFFRIGHSLLALLVGLAFGFLARRWSISARTARAPGGRADEV
jgi:hypothetical protein